MMVMPEDGWEERREGWRAYYQSVHLEVVHLLANPLSGATKEESDPGKKKKTFNYFGGER